MTFFQKRYFIQNWSVIKTTWYARPKKYIFKIKLWYSNFHQILPINSKYIHFSSKDINSTLNSDDQSDEREAEKWSEVGEWDEGPITTAFSEHCSGISIHTISYYRYEDIYIWYLQEEVRRIVLPCYHNELERPHQGNVDRKCSAAG